MDEGSVIMIEEKIKLIEKKTKYAKHKVLEMCVKAGMGHLTTAYSCAEIIATLYYDVMYHFPQNPNHSQRDRFIMSKNHGSLMMYPILADLGYFPDNELMTFMQDNSHLGGHSKLAIKGVDFAGGSLGIGLGVGAGLAYAAKMENENWYTFVLLGDGECYEGSIWETAMFASHNKLVNLIVIIDRNRLCCTDFTENILRLEPLEDKWRAFGWDTLNVDGHNIEELLVSFNYIRSIRRNKPFVVIANTTKGNGIDFMSNAPLYHGIAPKGDDIEKAWIQLEGQAYERS